MLYYLTYRNNLKKPELTDTDTRLVVAGGEERGAGVWGKWVKKVKGINSQLQVCPGGVMYTTGTAVNQTVLYI